MGFDGSALAMLLKRQVPDTLVFEQLRARGDAEYRAQIAADEANPHSVFCCCVCAVCAVRRALRASA